MALKSPPRGRAAPRTVTRTKTRRASRSASGKSRTGSVGARRTSGQRTGTRTTRVGRGSLRPANRPARQKGVAGAKRPSRRTSRTGDTAPASPRHHAKGPGGMDRATGRPAQHAPEPPLEFVEVPLSGSTGSSRETDSYAPKAHQAQARPKRRGFFGSLFGNG